MQPSKDLRLNGATVSAFRHAIHSCNIDAIPDIVGKLLETEAWKSFVANMESFENQTFTEFIRDPPFKGCGWETDKVTALIQQSGNMEVLRRWREATTAPAHRPPGSTDNISSSIKPEHGTSLAYTLDRLKRKDDELYAKVVAGEMSANAAALKANIRRKPLKHCPNCGHEWR